MAQSESETVLTEHHETDNLDPRTDAPARPGTPVHIAPVQLGNITVPFLHVVAEHDHIVTTEASAPLVKLVGSTDKEEVILKGGHVSLVAGANAQKRLWPRLDQWLQERSV